MSFRKLTHQAADSIRISTLRSRDCQTSQACGSPTKQRAGGEVHFLGICLVEIQIVSVFFDPKVFKNLALSSLGVVQQGFLDWTPGIQREGPHG